MTSTASNAPAAEGPGEALDRQHQVEVTAVLVGRALTSSLLGVAVLTLRDKMPRRGFLLAGAASLAGQSAWAARRVRRSGRTEDRRVGWADVLAGAGALAVETASRGTRDLPADPRWSLPLAVVVSAWLPFELEPRDLPAAGVAWSAAYVAFTRETSSAHLVGRARGQWLAEMVAPPICSLFCRRFAVQLRRQASQLDQARARAVDQADRLAREEERSRQFRVTHDSAVQVLETVAGGRELDDEVLVTYLDFEIQRLQRVLGGGDLVEGNSLVEGLSALRHELAFWSLMVLLDCPDPAPACEPESARALCGAVREALVNVAKHAGVHTASVSVAAEGVEVRVTVADDGRGFDPATPGTGFGLAASVRQRMAAIGGRVEVRSAPGSGVVVTLWAPARPSRARSSVTHNHPKEWG